MKLINFVYYFFFLTLGSILGVFFCNYTYFTFDSKVNIFELTSLIVTSGVAFYVAVQLNRVFSQANGEKALLIEELKKSINVLDRIHSSIECKSYKFSNIKGEFKLLNENLHLINNLLEESHCGKMDTQILRNELSILRRLTTGGTPIENVLTLDPKTYSEANNSFKKLKQHYFKTIFAVNKK